MDRNDISRIIEETIFEMLNEGYTPLVNLMMEHERRYGEGKKSKQQFLNETISALGEKLGIDVNGQNENQDLLNENAKMVELAKYLETEDENILRETRELVLESGGKTTFPKLKIGDKFLPIDDPSAGYPPLDPGMVLQKISKTHYKTIGGSASGVKFKWSESYDDKYPVELK